MAEQFIRIRKQIAPTSSKTRSRTTNCAAAGQIGRGPKVELPRGQTATAGASFSRHASTRSPTVRIDRGAGACSRGYAHGEFSCCIAGPEVTFVMLLVDGQR